MSRLIIPLVMLLIVSVLVSATIGVAVGLAHAMKWLVPAFDLTTCLYIILATLTFWGFIGFGFVMVTVAMPKSKFDPKDSEGSDDEDSEGSDDEGSELLEMHADLVADRLFEALSQRMDFDPRRGTRRRT